MLNAVRTTSPSAKPTAAPVAKPAAQAAESTLVRDSVAFKPLPVAQAKQVTINLPTIPQAVGGTLAGLVTAAGSMFVSIGMGFGGMGAAANLVGLAGIFIAAPAAAYFGGKLAGRAWEAMTK